MLVSLAAMLFLVSVFAALRNADPGLCLAGIGLGFVLMVLAAMGA
jgi:hypothetical protein